MLTVNLQKKRREIWGIVFLSLFFFVAIGLFSYDPRDPSFNSVSTSKEVWNLTGLVGSYTADLLFQTFGLSAFLVLFPVIFLSILCFFPMSITRKWPRIFGFLLLILFACGFLSLSFKTIHLKDQSLLAGGFTGHIVTSILLPYFNKVGSYIIILGGIAASSILSLNISLVTAGMSIVSLFLKLFSLFPFFKSRPVRKLKEEAYEPPEFDGVETEFDESDVPAFEDEPTVIETNEEKDEFSEVPDIPSDIIEESFERAPDQISASSDLAADIEFLDDTQALTVATAKRSRGSSILSATTYEFPIPKGNFKLPKLDILSDNIEKVQIDKETLLKNARILEQKLKDFNVEGRVVEVRPGPIITVYEFEPAPGIKVSRIVNLSDDLSLALSALSVRIVAPIPGKSVVGIELPNDQREIIRLKEILQGNDFKSLKYRLPLSLGKNISGEPIIADLARMPHLLVAGATGSGKSVFINSIVSSLLFRYTPHQLRFLMIDPKMLELSIYDDIPHLLLPVITDPKKAALALKWAVEEMDRRYILMTKLFVRNIDSYNKKIQDTSKEELENILKESTPAIATEEEIVELPTQLPYIIIVIDELADLMMVGSKDVELSIARLAQMARAAGIHLLVATQRPSVDVLTGLIKANFSCRISFQVPSKIDSRTILDCIGAEKLLGNGDMLFSPPGTSKVIRVHGAYVSDQEVKQLVEYLKKQGEPHYEPSILSKKTDEVGDDYIAQDDEKYKEALELVSKCRYASISMIQRRLRIGYNRAARMIEQMEADGIIGPADGAKPREILKSHPEA
jgi:S-DNA-T family DNA segregation ATPase FtsK/SpoIIIE